MTGMKGEHYVDDELYLSLEVVAELYEVRVFWLHEVYDLGLLGEGVDADSSVCIAAFQLDRVARIVRLHRVLGFDAETIAASLADTLP